MAELIQFTKRLSNEVSFDLSRFQPYRNGIIMIIYNATKLTHKYTSSLVRIRDYEILNHSVSLRKFMILNLVGCYAQVALVCGVRYIHWRIYLRQSWLLQYEKPRQRVFILLKYFINFLFGTKLFARDNLLLYIECGHI